MPELYPADSNHFMAELPTKTRFSLAYDVVGSSDILVKHPAGSTRIVEYTQSDPRQAAIRESLIQRGLILGKVISSDEDATLAFKVPKSARPIAYDACVVSQGIFSYNDERLFYDLGNLLGELYVARDEKLVDSGDIGRTIAFVEFTDQDERRLYFVPGIEKVCETLDDGVSPLGYYAGKLTEGFGHRFDNAGLQFRIGFAEATAPKNQ